MRETQKIAEKVLSKNGGKSESVASGKGGRRLTIHTVIQSRRGEQVQEAIDRVCKEITEASGRSTAGRPEGWNPRSK